MDDRKKQIEELEKSKRENQAALDSLLERFGETLLGRIGEETSAEGAGEDIEEYRRLQKEIAGFEASIQAVEEQIRRFRELEEKIELKEQEDNSRSKEMAGIYTRLGKAVLEDSAYTEFTVPFREQTETLVTKVRSLEGRVEELDQKEGNNVFAWIGKSAQALVLRSFLTKAQDNLEQLYRSAGERFSRGENARTESAAEGMPKGDESFHGDIAALLGEIEKAKNESRALSEELVKLREEKRKISEGFGIEGSPLKQIQTLKNHIAQARDNLHILYRRFGAEAAGAGPVDQSGAGEERRRFIEPLIAGDDRLLQADALRISGAIRDAETAVEKLRASLAIDEEKAKIEKCRRSIEDKRARITEAEKDIAGFEESIKNSEKYIEELRKLL
jgi:predicted  nucleic acid-binding Zn-ribbon protein